MPPAPDSLIIYSPPLASFLLLDSPPILASFLPLLISSFSSSTSRSFLFSSSTYFIRSSSRAILVQFRSSAELCDIVTEFQCMITVSTPAVWLARENIKRLTPRPCINVEYSHGVVYMEEKPVEPFHTSDQLSSIPIIYIPNPFST